MTKPQTTSIEEIMETRTPLSLSDTLSQFRVAVLERLNGNQIKIPDGLLLNTIFWLEAALKTQKTPCWTAEELARAQQEGRELGEALGFSKVKAPSRAWRDKNVCTRKN